jgi:hypothetical protein
VVGVRVRQQQHVESREVGERDAGRTHSWQEQPQRFVKIRIGQDSGATNTN